MSVEQGVMGIVVKQLQVDWNDVTREARFIDDLGASDHENVRLTMALEEHFGIEIPDDDREGLTTVGQMIDYIEARAG
jgi:acyl carrier protein